MQAASCVLGTLAFDVCSCPPNSKRPVRRLESIERAMAYYRPPHFDPPRDGQLPPNNGPLEQHAAFPAVSRLFHYEYHLVSLGLRS